MQASQETIAVLSRVLGFELIQVWSVDSEDSRRCIFFYSSAEMLKCYPSLKSGSYPIISPEESELALKVK